MVIPSIAELAVVVKSQQETEPSSNIAQVWSCSNEMLTAVLLFEGSCRTGIQLNRTFSAVAQLTVDVDPSKKLCHHQYRASVLSSSRDGDRGSSLSQN